MIHSRFKLLYWLPRPHVLLVSSNIPAIAPKDFSRCRTILLPLFILQAHWALINVLTCHPLSKFTADCDCSHEIKSCLLLGRKVLTNPDSIFKSRDITLPTKVHLVKAMGFPVVMYGCESWTVKKAEPWRIDAFELWCWRRLLRVPWIARRSN